MTTPESEALDKIQDKLDVMIKELHSKYAILSGEFKRFESVIIANQKNLEHVTAERTAVHLELAAMEKIKITMKGQE